MTVTPNPNENQSLADCLDKLAHANVESNSTMLSLIASVQAESEANSRKVDLLEVGQRETRRLLVMVAAALALMTIIGVANAINIYDTRRNASTTAAAARDAAGTYALLLDCLNPTGECGKRGVERNRANLDEVKLYDLITLYCARTNPAIADAQGKDFLACMKRLYPTGPELPTGR